MHFLDKVQLAYECPLRWEKLVGGGSRRFCATCQKHVTDLSAMTRLEAETLLRDAATPICVRVEVDAQGRAVHRPALRTAALAAAGLALAGCGPGLGETADTSAETGPLPIAELGVETGRLPEHDGIGAPHPVGEAPRAGGPSTGPSGVPTVLTTKPSLIPEVNARDVATGGVLRKVTEVVWSPEVVLMGKPAPEPTVVMGELPAEPPPLVFMGAPPPRFEVPDPPAQAPVEPPERMGRVAPAPR